MNALFLSVGYTLVDVSNTGIVTSDETHRRNQCRNWETLSKLLGLRVQLDLLTSPEIAEMDVTHLKFGEDFTGKQLVWSFKFGTEREGVFSSSASPYGTLESDCASVPVIIRLNETAKISTPTFCVSGTQKNIYFESIKF